MICAWEPQPKASSPFGKDACFGDSGGPLLLPQNTQLSSFRNEHPWLLGVTSFGSTNCNSIDRPGIYTRLANFSQWLENTTDNAGDGLVDASALLELPNAVRPMQAFNLVAGITNNSRINDLDSAVFEVTAANTTLVPPSGHGCVAIADGWRCSSASSLSANTKRELTFSATWTGADDQTLEATVHAYDDDHDDYRNANNTITGTANVTALPDPNLTFSILSNRNGEASITVTASNLSALNSVTGATLVISLPADLTVPTTPVGCNAIGTNQLSCPVGTLLPESSRLFNVTLRGQGAFLVPLYLQSGNGDIQPGDTSQSLIIRLTEFGSSGGAMLLLPLLLLYRRRS
jgi:hypothetical protein